MKKKREIEERLQESESVLQGNLSWLDRAYEKMKSNSTFWTTGDDSEFKMAQDAVNDLKIIVSTLDWVLNKEDKKQ